MKEPKRASFIRTLIIGTALILMVSGCASSRMPKTYMGHSEPITRVVLSPGDTIEVKFFYAPELNDKQQVRPDGNITLQLIDDVYVEGKTPKQVSDDLEKAYSGKIDKPDVTVIVRGLENRYVFVGGAVKQGGRMEMPGTLSALGAIIQAGGFDLRQAAPSQVVVIRQEADARNAYVLDFNETLTGKPRDPFYLHPMDIVYVPRSTVVGWNQWIDQYITKMVPQFGFTYSKAIGNDAVIGIDTSGR